MKGRLIELLTSKSCRNNKCPDMQCCDCEHLAIFDDDAERIADTILADGWIRPPCKVGTTIYTIKDGEVKKQFVVEVSQHYNGNSYIKYVPYDKNGIPELNWIQKIYSDKAIGKIIFFSEEEAEKALKGKDEGK